MPSPTPNAPVSSALGEAIKRSVAGAMGQSDPRVIDRHHRQTPPFDETVT